MRWHRRISTGVVVDVSQNGNEIGVPPSGRITLTGRRGFGFGALDVIQTILRDQTTNSALLQACVEFAGDGIATLSLDERETILASLFHSGASTRGSPVGDLVLRYS